MQASDSHDVDVGDPAYLAPELLEENKYAFSVFTCLTMMNPLL